jgi:hypothetical protein
MDTVRECVERDGDDWCRQCVELSIGACLDDVSKQVEWIDDLEHLSELLSALHLVDKQARRLALKDLFGDCETCGARDWRATGDDGALCNRCDPIPA